MAATTGSIATNNCTASSWRIPYALDFTIPVTAPGSAISRSANGHYYRHGRMLVARFPALESLHLCGERIRPSWISVEIYGDSPVGRFTVPSLNLPLQMGRGS